MSSESKKRNKIVKKTRKASSKTPLRRDSFRASTGIFSAKKPADTTLTLKALQMEYYLSFGINLRDRVLTLTGPIEQPMFDLVDVAMSEFEADGKSNVTVRIHSEGGSVYEALAIIGRLKGSKVSKITTEGYGQIMSAATMILACGEERRISKYAYFMHHESGYGVEYAKTSEHKDILEQVEREDSDWARWMAGFSKKSAKFWKETGCRKDAYFNPDELIRLGVADEIFGR